MSDQPNHPNETPRQSFDDSWQEVGKQFESLGNSLAQALRSAWSNLESNPETRELKTGLESMVHNVGQAIEEGAKTPEAQQLKEEAKRTAKTLRDAGESAVQEARPQLISALRQVNDELQKLIDKMENRGS
jgi:ElaB/YqjD/DUF883 family membrane-anchored ribosome-binding protein